MAVGYNRTSSADIIPTEVVRAGPINTELDAVASAMHETTGHNHNGTDGGGSPIDLANSVSGLLPLAKGGTNADLSTATTDANIVKSATALTYRKNNFTAVTTPSVTDDSASFYGAGSYWYNTLTSTLYVCLSASVGAASWAIVNGAAAAAFPATSNLGMGGFKFTNMADGSAATDSVAYGQIAKLGKISATDTTQKYAAQFFTTAITGALSLQLSTINVGGNEQILFTGSVGTLGLSTGSNQTTSFTAAVNTKYVCNFSAAATVTLPASASTGDFIMLAIGGGYDVTLAPNGLKVNASTSNLSIGPDRQTILLTYTDTTDGWV